MQTFLNPLMTAIESGTASADETLLYLHFSLL